MSLDLTLRRHSFTSTGVTSTLLDDAGKPLWPTLTRAFGPDNQPKTPPGRYLCAFGQHTLHSGPIATFEITGVTGHTGILFHPGNRQEDSDGCELVGSTMSVVYDAPWLNASVAGWKALLERQGTADFWLTVE